MASGNPLAMGVGLGATGLKMLGNFAAPSGNMFDWGGHSKEDVERGYVKADGGMNTPIRTSMKPTPVKIRNDEPFTVVPPGFSGIGVTPGQNVNQKPQEILLTLKWEDFFHNDQRVAWKIADGLNKEYNIHNAKMK